MSLLIDLAPEISDRLEQEAARLGVEPGEYAQRLIADNLPDRTMSGAEAIAFWERQGVLGLFSDRPDSPAYVRELRREAEAQRANP